MLFPVEMQYGASFGDGALRPVLPSFQWTHLICSSFSFPFRIVKRGSYFLSLLGVAFGLAALPLLLP